MSCIVFEKRITSTLWNTVECCPGFEDMKDEISSALKASYIFGLIFHWMCYFWVENLSNLCKLMVCGSQTLQSTQQTQRFPDIGLSNPVFTVENSADNNPTRNTQSKICTRNMHGVKPITVEHSSTAKPAELHNVKPVQFWRTSRSVLNADWLGTSFGTEKLSNWSPLQTAVLDSN